MPIYNKGGTDLSGIGKLYEFDGAAFNQIGKVYAYDGTTASLILSGGAEVLFDGGMVAQFEPYTHVSNSTYVYAYADNNGTDLGGRVNYNVGGGAFYTATASWRTSELIDLSQYSSITIAAKAYTRWDSYNGVRVEFWDANNNSVGSINIQENQKGVTTDGEWTFDLSAYNDAVKVGVTAWQTYSDGRGATFNLYKMVLS